MDIKEVPTVILKSTLAKWKDVTVFSTRLTKSCAICKWYWSKNLQNCHLENGCPIQDWCKKLTNFNGENWINDVESFNNYISKEINQRMLE